MNSRVERDELRQYLGKFVNFATGSLGGVLLAYLATYVLNESLSKEDMGKYSYVFNILNLAYPIFSLSIYTGYLRFINLYDSGALIRFVQIATWISTVLFGVAVILYFENVYYLLFVFVILYQERLTFFRSNLQIWKFNILNVGQKLIFLLAVVAEKGSLTAEISLLYIGASYFLTYLLAALMKGRTVVDRGDEPLDIEVYLKFCAVTMLTLIVNWVLTVSDQLIIEHFFGFESLAPYSVAYRIVTMIGLVSGIFLSYYPTMYFREMKLARSNKIILFRRCFMLILLVFAVALIMTKDYVYMAFGASKYVDDSDFFLPLLLGEVSRVLASVLMTFLTFQLKQSSIFWSMLAISILNIVLNLVFVPVLGPIAAAYSTLFCLAVYLVISYFMAYLPERKFWVDSV